MWSNLTGPQLGDRTWDPETFFATGRAEIDAALRRAKELGLVPRRRRRALDFGCGVGRLTQGLARHFDRVDGVDIAERMVREARRHDQTGGRCHYHVDTTGHLGRFADGSCDLVYSTLVLQHIEPVDALRYIAEMVRVLAPGGVLVFHVPSRVPGKPEEAIAIPPGTRRTRGTKPLSDGVCRAQITVRQSEHRVEPGETFVVDALVTNDGSETWPYRGASDHRCQIKLGATWTALRGGRHWADEARGNLPYDLAPGAAAKLSLALRAPEQGGDYRIELDMLQEAVCWFADRGSPRTAIRCHVDGESLSQTDAAGSGLRSDSVPPTSGGLRRRLGATILGDAYRAGRRRLSWWRSQRARQPVSGAVMEMHSIPEAEVRPVIEDAGGRLVATDHRTEDDGVESVHYWVTRQARRFAPGSVEPAFSRTR
jgi:SAM-dependent methyltransferase